MLSIRHSGSRGTETSTCERAQRTFERVRRIELQLDVEPSHYEPGQLAGETPLGPPVAVPAAGEQPGPEAVRL